MLKAEELRIGNLVAVSKQPGVFYKVVEIGWLDVTVCLPGKKQSDMENWETFSYPDLSPVVLMADLLLKIGFKKRTMEGSGFPIFWYSVPLYRPLAPHGSGKSFQLQGMIDNEKLPVPVGFTMESSSASREVKHLHELQNLYFGLMGEEMHVEL